MKNALFETEHFTVVPLRREHANHFTAWSTHQNPLLQDYNYSDLTEVQRTIWAMEKIKNLRKKYFAILNHEERMVAFVGFKELNPFHKSALLGIVLDPAYTSKGYGTEILSGMLDYFFNTMKMKTMNLEVNLFNQRAVALYERMGFLPDGEYLQDITSLVSLPSQEVEDAPDAFVIVDKNIYSRVQRMTLEVHQYRRLTDVYTPR